MNEEKVNFDAIIVAALNEDFKSNQLSKDEQKAMLDYVMKQLNVST